MPDPYLADERTLASFMSFINLEMSHTLDFSPSVKKSVRDVE